MRTASTILPDSVSQRFVSGIGRERASILRCGCCDQKLHIFYADDGLEIGGINGAIEDWREILLPLLLIERKRGRFVDVSARRRKSAKKQTSKA